MSAHQPHSDLEVAHYDEGLQFYQSQADRDASLPQVVSPSPEKIPIGTKRETEQGAGAISPVGGIKSRRKLYIWIAVAAIIVGAVVLGAALGTTLNQNTGNTDTPSSPSPDPENNGSSSPISGTSTISASNVTDADGYVHRQVYFQDRNDAIILRLWDSQNTTWETRNISEAVRTNLDLPEVDKYVGTPLAASSLQYIGGDSFESWVWYLNSNNQIEMAGSLDLAYTHESINVFTLPREFVPAPDSELAVVWQRCEDDCMGSWVVAYQNQDGIVDIVNGSGNWHLGASFESGVAIGSSLVLVPQIVGDFVTGLALLAENLLGSSIGEMKHMLYGTSNTDGESWVDNGRLLYGVPAPSPRLQFAAAPLQNFAQTLSFALLPNGTVTGCVWNQTDVLTTYPEIIFEDGGPEGDFIAIATTLDGMFYGLAEDGVFEYSIEAANPSTLNFIGRIFP